MIYALCFVLFMIGLYAVLTKKNIVKIVVGIIIMDYAVNLFIILLGLRKEQILDSHMLLINRVQVGSPFRRTDSITSQNWSNSANVV